jgi:hypothetical protein
MSDQKNHQFRPALFTGGRDDRSASPTKASQAAERNITEQQGWEAYRKWLSRVNAQPAQRSSVDASIYSWRGYSSWADKVRQTWSEDDAVES